MIQIRLMSLLAERIGGIRLVEVPAQTVGAALRGWTNSSWF